MRARGYSRGDIRYPASCGAGCTADAAQQVVPGRAAVPNARVHSDMASNELTVVVLDGYEVTWTTLAADAWKPSMRWDRLSVAARGVEQPKKRRIISVP